ncbi:terminase, partial [Xanthomonas oryzae pv. oryzae]
IVAAAVADLQRAIALHGSCGGKKDLERAERLLKKFSAEPSGTSA